jgi:predicted SprT family Zn-dependent metalloprotease
LNVGSGYTAPELTPEAKVTTSTPAQREAIARTLIAKWLPGTPWKFEWDSALRRFGACHYRTRRLTISAAIAGKNDDWDFIETMLHEIAHALAGPWAKHGPLWAAQCTRVGIPANRCYSSAVVATPRLEWTATCKGCGQVYSRRSLPKGVHACSKCCAGRGFNPAFTLNFVKFVDGTRKVEVPLAGNFSSTDLDRILALRRQGLSHRRIEAAMGWKDEKGFRARKALLVLEAAGRL